MKEEIEHLHSVFWIIDPDFAAARLRNDGRAHSFRRKAGSTGLEGVATIASKPLEPVELT